MTTPATKPVYPRLGLWWPDPVEQSDALLARYDWVTLFDGSRNAVLRALHPGIVLLASVAEGDASDVTLDPTERGYEPPDENVYSISPRWALTQVGTTLTSAVSPTSTTFTVASTKSSAGALFMHGEPAVIGDELVMIQSVGPHSIVVQRGLVWGLATNDRFGRGAAYHSAGTRIAACVVAWPRTITMDMTAVCPSADVGFGPETWLSYSTRHALSALQDGNVWDGLFLDDCAPDEAWVIGRHFARSIDMERSNVVPSSYADFNDEWNAGVRSLLTSVRAGLGSKYLVCNQPVAIDKIVNGFAGEDYPRRSWDARAWQASIVGTTSAPQPATWSLYQWHDHTLSPDFTSGYAMRLGTPLDLKRLRFGLCTALVSGSCFCASRTSGHAQQGLVWADEYDDAGAGTGYLGTLVSQAPTESPGGVWRRDFANGIALVNPTRGPVIVSLGATFVRIKGSQAPTVNDGSRCTRVTVPAQDGLILLRTK